MALAVSVGLGLGIMLNNSSPVMAISEVNEREAKLRKVLELINYQYVDPVNTDSLLDQTIQSMLKKLDPHSTYIPQNQVAAAEESMHGEFVGVGIEFKIFRDTLSIVRIIPGGPAEAAGLKAGQRILRADSVRLYGAEVTNKLVMNTLKGPRESSVPLLIYDPGQRELLNKTVQRGEVPVNSVSSRFLVNDSTGYLRLTRFTERSSKEVYTALSYLIQNGATQIIFDLRDNPGGLLSEARQIADQFLSGDKTIVVTKDRRGQKTTYRAKIEGLFEEGDLAVLINGGSASASEIVAGAIQDNDRGVIVGQRSFGKGLVQEEVTMSDGSKLRLTTQRYFTPTGRSIQKDFEHYNPHQLSGAQNQYQLNPKPHDSGEQALADSLPTYRTPEGRVVKGGGGIYPQVLSKIDSNMYSRRLYQLAMAVNLENRAFAFVDAQRAKWEDYTLEEFMAVFKVDTSVLEFFFRTLPPRALEDIPENERAVIKNRLKSLVAYQLYGSEGYRRTHMPYDPYIQDALKALGQPVPMHDIKASDALAVEQEKAPADS